MGMWQELVAQVSKVLAPVRRSTGEGEITFATSGTAVRIEIPSWLKGCYAEFTAAGNDCDVLFGGSAVDCVYGQVSTIASEVVTTHASSGRRISAGSTRGIVVPNEAGITHMSAEAAGAGVLNISLTSVKVTK